MTARPNLGPTGGDGSARDMPDAESRALLPKLTAMLLAPPALTDDPWTAARKTASRIFTAFEGLTREGMVEVNEVCVRGAAGPLPALSVRPKNAQAAPLIAFFHGGGWCLGQSSDYRSLLAELAHLSAASIVSVDYRLAPEHPFPAAYFDALAATADIAERAHEFGGDPNRFGVMGDSAGGNLAAVVAQHFPRATGSPSGKDFGAVELRAQFLLYPMLDVFRPHTAYRSRIMYGNGDHFLANLNIDASAAAYLDNAPLASDPRVSPILAPKLEGLAPAYILAPGCDPLRDEAEVYARRLGEAGVETVFDCHAGALHAFLSFGVLTSSRLARRRLADEIVRLLSSRAEAS